MPAAADGLAAYIDSAHTGIRYSKYGTANDIKTVCALWNPSNGGQEGNLSRGSHLPDGDHLRGMGALVDGSRRLLAREGLDLRQVRP